MCTFTCINTAHTLLSLEALLDIVTPVLHQLPHQSSELSGSPFASSRKALNTEMFWHMIYL